MRLTTLTLLVVAGLMSTPAHKQTAQNMHQE
jgi:hypothetical protein